MHLLCYEIGRSWVVIETMVSFGSRPPNQGFFKQLFIADTNIAWHQDSQPQVTLFKRIPLNRPPPVLENEMHHIIRADLLSSKAGLASVPWWVEDHDRLRTFPRFFDHSHKNGCFFSIHHFGTPFSCLFANDHLKCCVAILRFPYLRASVDPQPRKHAAKGMFLAISRMYTHTLILTSFFSGPDVSQHSTPRRRGSYPDGNLDSCVSKKTFRICNRTFSCSVVWSRINISSASLLLLLLLIIIIKARFYCEINHPQDSSPALCFITSFGDEIPKLKLHFPLRVGWHECASIESAGVERKQSIVHRLVWWIR